MKNIKIRSFTDLIVWKEGHTLVLTIHALTKNFPRSESYSLVDQMRRSVVSVTCNIAEGFSRKSRKEKVQFYYMSLGSVTDLQNQLIVSKDLQYISNDEAKTRILQSVKVHKLINGLIKSAQDHT